MSLNPQIQNSCNKGKIQCNDKVPPRVTFAKNHMIMQRFILTLLLSFLGLAGFAQQVNVTGVVKDAATGETVIGASVLIKGTTEGTVTSFDGDFSINVKQGQEIVVSSIGYDSYTFKASELHLKMGVLQTPLMSPDQPHLSGLPSS